MPWVDLNADLGEGVGDDAALLGIVSTANVAAGGHAGGGQILSDTIAQAVACGVVVGAHPSYPDRVGFGRRSMADTHARHELAAVLTTQIETVRAAGASRGAAVAHVKAHGALYNDAMLRTDVAEAVIDAALAASIPVVMGLPRSALAEVCARRGVAFVSEGYADRAYEPDGTLTPRSQADAVIHDDATVAERVERMVVDRTVVARDGSVVTVDVQTICVHGDTPGALGLARAVRTRLESRGVVILPFTRP